MSIKITWDDIANSTKKPLTGGDKIQYVEVDCDDESCFELELQAGSEITWRKAATLKADGFNPTKIETQDSLNGPFSFRIRNTDLDGVNFYLGKAKSFGVKVDDMYIVTNLADKKGKRIELKWIKD